MDYTLVFRKNGFIGLYTKDKQVFNTVIELLPESLKREFGETPQNVKVLIEHDEIINVLGLSTLQEYMGLKD